MTTRDPAAAALRLREGERTPRRQPVDAEISVRRPFWALLAVGVLLIVLQSTLLHGVTLRGAHVSLVTVLLVWTGIRFGIVTGGWLGLLCGLLEDALGGGGTNVIGSTLAGFGAGLLANRFFWDSLPVFLSTIAAATVIRFASAYLVFVLVYGERGRFVPMSHELFWTATLNCAAGAVVLLWSRVSSHYRTRLP